MALRARSAGFGYGYTVVVVVVVVVAMGFEWDEYGAGGEEVVSSTLSQAAVERWACRG